MRLFLDVPFEEKDEAKALGARWNPKVKKWYADVFEKDSAWQEDYVKFAKWILRDCDEAMIASEYLFILETSRECWKCHRQTNVIGLGIGEFVEIYIESGNVECEIWDFFTEQQIHLAWVDKEDYIPPKLLRYLKKHYSVKTGYSKFCNGYTFANHCDCCGALQGNWFLFNEPDSPLSTCTTGNDLINRMKRIKIKGIPIYDDLKLNWNVHISSNDDAYLKYADFEELILSSDPRNEYVTYEELYS